MIKKLLSRLMGATKRKRSAATRQRGLAFEKMEDRLALSTTTGTEFNPEIDLITASQAGVIAINAVTGNQFVLLNLTGSRVQFPVDGRDFLTWQRQYTGPGPLSQDLGSASHFLDYGLNVSAAYGSNGDADAMALDSTALHSSSLGQKLTINQPPFGNVENSNGIVAIGAIFESQLLSKNLQGSSSSAAAARHQAATELAPAIVPVNEVSLSRGREMYFDVAGVSNYESSSRQDENDQTMPTRVSFNSLTKERERLRTASKNVPTNNSTKAAPDRGTQTDEIRTSVPSEAELNAVPKVSEAELPALPQENSPQGEKVSATSARDQAFANWQRHEFLDSDDILSVRTDESDDDSSSWPILAALAVGGLVVRSRRIANSSLWHQQPPRRKKSAIL